MLAQELGKMGKNTDIKYSDLEYISANDLLMLTVAMMLADGKIDPNEYDLISKISKLKHISENEINRCVEKLKSMNNPIEYVLENSTMSLDENVLKFLIDITVSDREIDEDEVKLLCRFGELLEISPNKIKSMIQKATE